MILQSKRLKAYCCRWKILDKTALTNIFYSIEPQNCKTGGEICEELGDCCDGMTQCFGDETKKCTYLHINL